MTIDPDSPTPARSILPVRTDARGCIDEDVPCRRCGYNLRTLSMEGRCPECGTAVGRSLHGDLLRFADPGWVQSLASGMNWILAGMVIGFFAGGVTGGLVAGLGLPVILLSLVTFGLSLIGFVGYWKVTAPDPAEPDAPGGYSVRKLLRGVQLVGLVLTPINLGLSQSFPTAQIWCSLFASLLGIVATYATFTYGRQLALRLPAEKLARHCRTVMWAFILVGVLGFAIHLLAQFVAAGPVTTAPVIATSGPTSVTVVMTGGARPPATMVWVFGGCFVGLTSVVFGIWAIRILLSFRKQFRLAAQLAVATWAAPLASAAARDSV